MPSTQKDIEDHIAVNAELWRIWKEHGVTEHTSLTVDFRFYSAHRMNADEMNADELVRVLTEAGYGVTKRKRWTFVFRGFEVVATHTSRWTLGQLQDQAREFMRIAEALKVLYEGFGAEMPGGDGDHDSTAV